MTTLVQLTHRRLIRVELVSFPRELESMLWRSCLLVLALCGVATAQGKKTASLLGSYVCDECGGRGARGGLSTTAGLSSLYRATVTSQRMSPKVGDSVDTHSSYGVGLLLTNSYSYVIVCMPLCAVRMCQPSLAPRPSGQTSASPETLPVPFINSAAS